MAENTALRTWLSTFGITAQTVEQLEPVVIWPTQELVKVFSLMGEEPKLGLSGRPKRPIGALGSSQVYRIMGRTVVAYPLVFDVNDFYISSDANSLINNVWFTLDFISRHFHFQQVQFFLYLEKLTSLLLFLEANICLCFARRTLQRNKARSAFRVIDVFPTRILERSQDSPRPITIICF